MTQKPSAPKGMRDFSPVETVRRNYIFDIIRSIFQHYCYLPIETPAMESLSTLLGKYGEEGDKMLFKVLNSGDYLKNVNPEEVSRQNIHKLTPLIAEKGLRFDLTVPFARYVVQNRHDITFPFKRYQIQPVWRADKPQKGRYREFYQCDVDVIGSNSLLNEVELIQIIDEVFEKLKIESIIKINNRKILNGITEIIGESDKFTEITTAIDKLEKIGLDEVIAEIKNKGVSVNATDKLRSILMLKGKLKEVFPQLTEILKESKTGTEGVNECMTLMRYLKDLDIKSKFSFDLSLARGLDYYTGAIIEVVSKEIPIGSICGGGRYDNLTGIFGLPDVSGVGISFGADRIYDVMKEMKLFPEQLESSTQVMFVNFGEEEARFCLPYLSKLRNKGINAEIYPDPVKMKKQMAYADKKNIPFVILVGTKEIKSGKMNLKDMKTGKQKQLDSDELIKILNT